MNDRFTILVADRNRYVRDFLRREFAAAGYRVVVAKDAIELRRLIQRCRPLHLLVLDLEIPYMGGVTVLEQIRLEYPSLPVILHMFMTEEMSHPAFQDVAAVVEKSGNPDELMRTVSQALRRRYPQDFVAEHAEVL
ncbi:MAG: response regulator [Deltaproteobacteria bacterium]|nr:response regulator [Deltaproteobacteria bacterium]